MLAATCVDNEVAVACVLFDRFSKTYPGNPATVNVRTCGAARLLFALSFSPVLTTNR